jgi:aryl-alcohol dehydrogenase-like predicted oxidoreductase
MIPAVSDIGEQLIPAVVSRRRAPVAQRALAWNVAQGQATAAIAGSRKPRPR